MNRLAVLLPVFNDQDGLDRTMASLLRDGGLFDVFIVDDGSDPPIEVPPRAARVITIGLMRLPANGGITRALNAGLERILSAGYDYVGRIDAGDLSLPGRFAAQMAFLDTHPDHAVVGTCAAHVDDDGHVLFVHRPPTEHDALMPYMRRRNGLEHPTAMIRVTCLEKDGCYDPRFCGSEDYELWLRLARRHKLANLPMVFVRKEVNDRQITARPFRSATRLRVQLRHFEPFALNSWIGVARSLLALATPRRAMLWLKGWGSGRVKRASPIP